MLKLQCTHDNVDDTDILIMFIQNSDHNMLSGFNSKIFQVIYIVPSSFNVSLV